MPHTIFIDGEAGTTGLTLAHKLSARADITLLRIAPETRKDNAAKAALYKQADLVVLCLPDAAAREAVALADGLGEQSPRILDASTAHRVAPGWVYGFAELAPTQGTAIKASRRVANVGCFAVASIALIRPLVDAGIFTAQTALTINAVSGYSGGGKSMIAAYEAGQAPAFELYGLGFDHKHIPEIMAYGGLAQRPIFIPSVGNFAQGMLVSIPLHLYTLPTRPKVLDLEAALRARYRQTEVADPQVVVREALEARLDALALNTTNLLELRVFGDEAKRQAVLVARLDNLGKGAAGAALQNIDLMLGQVRR